MARKRNNPDSQSRSGKVANAIDAATIAELLAKGRSRGDYETFLRDFLKSEEAGWEVPLNEGAFAGKNAKQVKTSLDNARKRMGEDGKAKVEGGNDVKVIVADDKAYVINTAIPLEA